MKLKFLCIAFLTFTVAATAQKKELKTLDKSIDKGEFAEAKTQLTALEGMMSAMDDKQKEEFYFLKGKAYLGAEGNTNAEELITGLDALAKVNEFNEGSKFGKDAVALVTNAKNTIIKSVQADEDAEKYSDAATKLEKLYSVSPQDTSFLYYAANDAIRAKDYANALDYLNTLKDIKYDGVETTYVATDVETKKEVRFGSKNEMDLAVMAKSHTDPKTQLTDSKRPLIYELIVKIYNQEGKPQEALDMIDEAIELNPEEIELKSIRLNLYRQLGMNDEYDAAAEEMLSISPDDPTLYVNLGVSANNAGDTAKAQEYYKKALEIDPASAVANVNMAASILDEDKQFIEEMNSLGNSKADNARYEEIKKQRMQLYKDAAPYLESAVEAEPDRINAVRTLYNIYTQLGEQDKADAYKAKLDALEGGN